MLDGWKRIAPLLSDRLYTPFLGMAVATGSLLILLGFFSYRTLENQEELVAGLAAQRGGALVSAIEASLHAGRRMSWHQNAFQTLIEELGQEEGVAYLAVLDASGKVLAHSDSNRIGKRSPDLVSMVRTAHAATELVRMPGTETIVLFARHLRPRAARPGGMGKTDRSRRAGMGLMQGMPMPAAPTFHEVEKLTAVAGIRAEEFEALHRESRRQTLLIALAVGLMLAGAVYVGFVVQGYQLAHSNLRRLEQVQNVLNKFVPSSVVKLLEHEPSAAFEKTEQDVTVMFLDIAGYTVLSEELPREELNTLVERYFARFLDHVNGHGGDVTETAGDGLMVLFRSKDPSDHPRAAAHAALGIRLAAEELNTQSSSMPSPVRVNIGINTGPCLVGSTKIRAASGERWTFTATGLVTNVAARLCAQAIGGEVLLGPEAAARLDNEFPLEPLGERQFKNVAEPVSIFRLGEMAEGRANFPI
ncbi:adenylate/guanylate cyclase domain-containing protein [Nitrospinota bacterium]